MYFHANSRRQYHAVVCKQSLYKRTMSSAVASKLLLINIGAKPGVAGRIIIS
jgi:hypothetical protein